MSFGQDFLLALRLAKREMRGGLRGFGVFLACLALGVGAIAALGIAVGNSDAPWWMPILAFAVIAAVVYRILRPRMRHPSIEDEI